MNTLQMQCFLSIAENRSFSRTARELYVSQPTLTKHIQHLENELQVLLFDRSKHPIELTGYGELYYQAFSDFFGELKRIRQISLKHNDSFKGTLNIGILSGWKLPAIVQQTLTAFCEIYPDIQLTFENHNIKRILSLLHKEKLDACFIMKDFIPESEDTNYLPLFDVPKYLIYSPKLFPSEKQDITVADMKNEVFFSLYEDDTDYTRPLIQKYCQQYNFTPITGSLPNIESVISNIEFGKGIAILDGLTTLTTAEKIEKLTLSPPHTLCLAWQKTPKSSLLPLLAQEFQLTFAKE